MSTEPTVAEQEIIEMAVKGGFAPVAIAEQLEVPIGIVYSTLKKFSVATSRHGVGNKQTGLDDKQREQIALEYDAGASHLDLACKYGISRTAFIKILEDFGVEYRSLRSSRQEIAARDRLAVKLYIDDVSVSAIQADTGITAARLYVLLRRENIPLRRGG